MALTDVQIRNLKPKEKPYKIGDRDGLYILVQPNGSKYWRFKYRHLDKEKVLSMGVYPEVTLAEARTALIDARRMRREGGDPAAEKKKQKQVAFLQANQSFEAIAREWFEQQEECWKPKHRLNVMKRLERELFPIFGSRPIREIDTPALVAVLKNIEKRGSYETAKRCLQHANAVFRYAIQTGRAKENPCREMKGALKARKVQNYKALDESEVGEFLRKLDGYNGDPETKIAIHLVVYNGLRTSEVIQARWSEFNLDKAEWLIPAERMKNDKPHWVPLSRQSVEKLRELKQLRGHFELLFPCRGKPRKPMSNNTMLYAAYRMGYHGRTTIHGFRSVASTILNEKGFSGDAIERQLSHVEKDQVRAAYNRAEHRDVRREMMQWYADRLDVLKLS